MAHLFSEVTMQPKEIVSQRPLFAEWPAWRQLPTEARQQVEHLLANMCLEVIQACNDSNDTHDTSEQCDEHERSID
jgi:hypothetical protein